MSIAELRKYGAAKPRTTREWWDNLTDEERPVVAAVILNQTAPVAVQALREHADFPFGRTALKDLRAHLKGAA